MCMGTSSGTLTQLLHFGPLIAIFLISYITACGYYCLVQWWPSSTLAGQIHMAIYLAWPLVIFYNYFNALFLGPGFVAKNWKPENKELETKLQYCKICKGFKAPRSHHCRKCNRCVLKMDHHCPWINTCCGHFNHASFVYFLLTAPLGCSHALLVLVPSIYRAIFRNYYIFYKVTDVPIVSLEFFPLLFCMFATGMAIGVTIAVGILLIIQLKVIVKNQTGIENWILKKANHRREHNQDLKEFIYPYHLGLIENIRQVINWKDYSFKPIGNGIWWNVHPETDQFTLTIEQLFQKEEKRNHSVQYKVVKTYNGAFFPFSFGFKTFCCFPWTEDPRVPLFSDEIVKVTRWQKNWLYGEVVSNEISQINKRKAMKGWFPIRAVKYDDNLSEVNTGNSFSENESNKKRN